MCQGWERCSHRVCVCLHLHHRSWTQLASTNINKSCSSPTKHSCTLRTELERSQSSSSSRSVVWCLSASQLSARTTRTSVWKDAEYYEYLYYYWFNKHYFFYYCCCCCYDLITITSTMTTEKHPLLSRRATTILNVHMREYQTPSCMLYGWRLPNTYFRSSS